MGQGEDRIARSLLDLQPTAIVEFYRIYPDRINKPTISIDIHGGSIFKDAIKWQGIRYLPIPIEAEGFEIASNGKLPRPKIRIANKDFLITSLLQNNNDFKNAEIVRKRTFLKYLDNENFDGQNPFGTADSTAEISEERYVIGQKTQENKLLVEFELTSPLDLENYEVNHRRILGKYCYWTYRGAGCQYEGPPINREDGEGFKRAGTGELIVPNVTNFNNLDPTLHWQATKGYMPSDIAYLENSKVLINPLPNQQEGTRTPATLKTWYVCTSGNTGQRPEDNPTYWQKDGCNKKISSCKLRFNEEGSIFYEKFGVESEEEKIIISGNAYVNNSGQNAAGETIGNITEQAGIFISSGNALTGFYTDDDGENADWTIALFADVTEPSHRAGILDTRTGFVDFGYGHGDVPSDRDGPDTTVGQKQKMTWYTERGRNHYIGVGLPVRHVANRLTQSRIVLSFGALGKGGRNLLVLSYKADEYKFRTYNLQTSGQAPLPHTTHVHYTRRKTWEFLPSSNCFSLGAAMNYGNSNTHWGKHPLNDRDGAQRSAHAEYMGCAIWNRVLADEEVGILLENVYEKQEGDFDLGEVGQNHVKFRDYASAPSNLVGDNSNLVAWFEGAKFPSLAECSGVGGSKVDLRTLTIDHPHRPVFLNAHAPNLHLTGYHDVYSGVETFIRPEYETVSKNYQYYKLPFGGFPGTDGFTYEP